ncbi:MAG: FecR domain-containing protein [Spirochaetaceae bacterium]|nr:FecR domain-containing protein [Spirochaetaceae bacterium]
MIKVTPPTAFCLTILLASGLALSCAGSPAAPSEAQASAPPPAGQAAASPTAPAAPAAALLPAGPEVAAAAPTAPAAKAASAAAPVAPATAPAEAKSPAPQASAQPSAAPQAPAPAGAKAAAPQAPATTKVAPPPAAPVATPAPAAAPQRRPLGEIVYAEGEVGIRRGEKLLGGADADIGARVLAYDLLLTGPKSRAEIDLGSAAAGGARVKVGERSAFYFDTAELDDGTRRSLIRLLAGSLALKVEKLGSGELTIATTSAVLGVRGTTFSVDAAPDGSLLVACAEGRVACRGPDGREFVARPGSAVEAKPAGQVPGQGAAAFAVAPRPLPADRLADYRASWLLDREAELGRTGAALAVSLAAEAARARPDFDAAYAKLEAQAQVLANWERLLAAGGTIGLAERMEEKKSVAAALFACLKALPAYERPHYRLADLAARRASGKPLGGEGSAAAGEAIAAFESGREAAEVRFGKLRRALYLFSKLAADSPLGEFFGEKAAAGSGPAASLLDLGADF